MPRVPTVIPEPMLAELQHGGWRIGLTAVPEFRNIFKSVGETGGYAFTHLERVERADGSLFSAPDADAVSMRCGDSCRLRGAACSLPVRWGAARMTGSCGKNGVDILAFAERILPRAQQLPFPEGIAYDGDRFNRTAATAPPFNYLAPSESADEKMVSRVGIEPERRDRRPKPERLRITRRNHVERAETW